MKLTTKDLILFTRFTSNNLRSSITCAASVDTIVKPFVKYRRIAEDVSPGNCKEHPTIFDRKILHQKEDLVTHLHFVRLCRRFCSSRLGKLRRLPRTCHKYVAVVLL